MPYMRHGRLNTLPLPRRTYDRSPRPAPRPRGLPPHPIVPPMIAQARALAQRRGGAPRRGAALASPSPSSPACVRCVRALMAARPRSRAPAHGVASAVATVPPVTAEVEGVTAALEGPAPHAAAKPRPSPPRSFPWTKQWCAAARTRARLPASSPWRTPACVPCSGCQRSRLRGPLPHPARWAVHDVTLLDKRRPTAVTLLGQGYVLWFDAPAGAWRLAQDRCAAAEGVFGGSGAGGAAAGSGSAAAFLECAEQRARPRADAAPSPPRCAGAPTASRR
jgi:hypothetical protein